MRTKQIKLSKQLILEGFFSLLRNEDYNRITMSKIAEEAMVSRMTLYRYFNTKEDILSYFMNDLFENIKNELLNSTDRSLERMLFLRNQIIYQNKYFKIIFDNKSVEELLFEMSNKNMNLMKEYIDTDITSNYRGLFISGGIESITKNWIVSGFKESPETITSEIMKLIDLLSV